MVSAAKDSGSNLWPSGVSDIEDLPYDLSIAIDQALRILSWQENLGSEEMPPQWMWHLDWEIEAWFIDVKNKREEKYNPKGNSTQDDAAWEDNEYASRFK